ncbi:MAG: glycosyltransferase [Pseudomonadota bacterium]
MKAMILVTHLLGTGHLSRALTLGRAFAAQGHDVGVVSGGVPAPHLSSDGLRLLQLEPVKSDGVDFSRLLDASGQVAGQDALDARRADLLSLYDDIGPDILITELFPFGRRILRDEFTTLLERARGKAMILSSIRDIVHPPSGPSKVAYAKSAIDAFYDGVLVHSDPKLLPLSLSWPDTEGIADKLFYTGFVAPDPAEPSDVTRAEVIVSAGGGAVGGGLFKAAIEAAARSDRTWRLLVGRGHEALLDCHRAPNLIIEPARPDFRNLLTGAAASVSLCGYNTAMDVLQAGVPAVFVPFDDGNEVEQTIRAKGLSQRVGIEILAGEALSGTTLREKVESVIAGPRPEPFTSGFGGAARTVEIATRLWRAKKA